MTYKIASDLAQRRARQLWLADLQGDAWQGLTIEEQRDSIKRKLAALQRECQTLPKGKRAELGKVHQELQEMLRALRPKMKGPKTVPGFFLDVARERLQPFLFKTLMNEASMRAKAAEGGDGL